MVRNAINLPADSFLKHSELSSHNEQQRESIVKNMEIVNLSKNTNNKKENYR